MENKIIFAISQLSGGGAEHVVMHLANYMHRNGQNVQILVTNQQEYKSDKNGLNENINVYYLTDYYQKYPCSVISKKMTSLVCRTYEKMHLQSPDYFIRRSFDNVYGALVQTAIHFLNEQKKAVVIAFLQPTIQMMMLACEVTGNPIIISERSNPYRFFKTRYAPYFLKHYYPNVDWAVFQTDDAQKAYPASIQAKSNIILNPISSALPIPYQGTRKKKIVNFCRLSHEKNIALLVDSFEVFYQTHMDYTLEIYGNGEQRDAINAYASLKNCASAISLLPHQQDLHASIRDYMMFVSSSDYEGMSNSMLEAMAIGLPTICTDCPIGGARTVIRDGENGLLVPIKDVNALATAMACIADDSALAERLSKNAQKIRYTQSLEEIGNQWLQCIAKVRERA